MAKKIIRHELVSIAIPANSTLSRFNIPDLPNLRNVHTFGIQVYTDEITTRDIISQNPVVNSTAVLRNSFITLVNYGGKEFLKQAPATIFQTIVLNNTIDVKNEYEQDFKQLIGQKINYPKSFVEFSAPPATAVDTAYIFSVYYSLPMEEEKRESGYSFGNKG
jgi:hypothetical protein